MERFLFSRIEVWLVLLLIFFFTALGGVWAYAVVQHRAFPHAVLSELRAFVQGVPGDERSVWVRLTSSGGYYNPRAFPATNDTKVLPDNAFAPITAAPDAAQPLPEYASMRLANPGGDTRYFVVFGSFAFDGEKENLGTIAIDSTGVLHRAWPSQVDGGEYLGPHIGLSVSDDGVIATNSKGIMTAQSWCGEKLWQAPWVPHPDGIPREHNAPDAYDWHHDISYHDGAFWSFIGADIAAVDAATGEIATRITGVDLIRWSWRDGLSLMDSRADIFDARRLSTETAAALLPEDPFHFNKVEVLSEDLAPYYPGLEAGDILFSARDLNLVAIVRPSEERFVWWRYGLTSRQHDATFIDGGIELFDNKPFTDPPAPAIQRLEMADPQAVSTVFDLSEFGMVMRRKGNFERRGDDLLVVDDESGRMIAARLSGDLQVVFENGYAADGESGNLQLRNAAELSPEAFAAFQAQCN